MIDSLFTKAHYTISWAKLTLVPRWIGADWLGHPVGQRNALTALNKLIGDFLVIYDSFCIDFVVIFAYGNVQSAVDARPRHVKMHLHKMFGL
jgi:hypothetical protein